MNTSPHKHKLVIVGGGFAGVRVALRLASHAGLDITLISSQDHFSYYPQLYHAATGGSRAQAAIPLGQLFAGKPITIIHDTITNLDPKAKTVSSTSATYPYDDLILALGTVTNYFGLPGLPELSYDIKTIEGAERFKQHLHQQLAEGTADQAYVVVGAGPTGVELAASLSAYLGRIAQLHGLAHPRYTIKLVEAAPRILPRSPEATARRVHRRLTSLGIDVMTAATVKAQTADTLQLADQSISTQTVVWTAGMANNPFFKTHPDLFTLAKNGKVQVDDHLQVRPHIYILGDNAATPYSGMAQTALFDADFVATDLMSVWTSHPRAAYRPKSPISVIPVGQYWAAAQWGPLELFGLPGYFLRRCADLIGYADIQAWPQAVQLWLKDTQRQDNCPVCSLSA